MLSSYSELRRKARESLRGYWGEAAAGILLVYVIQFGMGIIPILGTIGSIVCSGALSLGTNLFYLEISRSSHPAATKVLNGFRQFGRAFRLGFLIWLFTLLWTFLFIIPGIIAAIRYSQAYFILYDNPEIGALEAIRRSKEMMKGQKGRYFVLGLTFIGWWFLLVLSFGIASFWIMPYIHVTHAHFYEELKRRNEEPPVPIEYQFSF